MSFKAGVEGWVSKGGENEQDNSTKDRSARFASFMDEALGLLAAEFSYQGAECLERVFDLAYEAHREVDDGLSGIARNRLEAMKTPGQHGVNVACDDIVAKLADTLDVLEVLTSTHKASAGLLRNNDPQDHQKTQGRLAAASAVLRSIRKDVLAISEPPATVARTDDDGFF